LLAYKTECETKCNKLVDCVQEFYKFEAKDNKDGHKYITIKHSVEPDIYYESNFKMTMEEYLCLVASILSVWFGFSIILFTDFISTMVMKLMPTNKLI